MKQFAGNINQINLQGEKTVILGWLWDRSNPSHKCFAVLKINEQIIQRFECCLFREDLKKNKIGDGHHAFQITLNKKLSIEEAKQLTLHPVGNQDEILQELEHHHQPNIVLPDKNNRKKNADGNKQSNNNIQDGKESLSNNSNAPYDFSQIIDIELGSIARRGGTDEEVLDYLGVLGQQNPNNYSIDHKIGDFYRDRLDYEKAISCYQTAIEKYSHAFWSYHHLGVCYAALNQWNESEKYISVLAEINPQFWEQNKNHYLVNFHLACRYENQGKVSQAIKQFHQTFQLDNQSIQSLYRLLKLYWKQHSLVETLQYVGQLKLSSEIIDKLATQWVKNAEENNRSDKPKHLLYFLLLLVPENMAVHRKLMESDNEVIDGFEKMRVKNIQTFRFYCQLEGFDYFCEEIQQELDRLKGKN